MRCPICDSTGKWENVDQYRHKPVGMAICNGCGFVGYPAKYKSEDEAKAYYLKDYRQPPNVNNFFTGQKKLHMHSAFLTDLLKGWREKKLETPVVGEVGAAYGMFLNWIRTHFPKADINGTEYALSYRRNAWHEYKINLGVDFDRSKKYHLIASYKVAEHQLDIDKRLKEYAEALHEDGFLYVSVPTWFERMSNFGLDGFDIEYYYHSDHINVWTRRLFETLLARCGLEIVKQDHVMYDSTYLCRRNDELMKKKPEYEQPLNIKQIMAAIKDATLAFESGNFDLAVKKFANFPSAWLNLYEVNRAKAHASGQGQMPFEFVKQHFLNPALESCPNSLDILRLAVDIHMRYDHYQEAANWCQKALDARPNNAAFLMALIHCFREIGLRASDPADKIKMITEARECARYLRDIDAQMRNEVVNWIYRDNSEIPTPF